MDLITITLIVVSCSILALGCAVLYGNRTASLSRLYFYNILTIVAWSVTMIFYRLSEPATIVIWTKLLYIAASLIASNFLYFAYVFPRPPSINPTVLKALILFPNLILIGLIWSTDRIIAGAQVSLHGENVIFWGKLYIAYVLYILFYFNFAFYWLYRKIRAATDKTERLQLIYVLLGYGASGMISFASNLILPTFGYFALNWLGQISTILMAGSATYAMFKHHLFNAKVIVTELFTFALWITLLVRFMTAETVSQRIMDGVTTLLTLVVGVFLIRSVIREVDAREKIEKLAADLGAANARLTELDRQKSEFVSFATHQLRAPLTAMKGYASLILEGDLGRVPKKAAEGVKRIFESAETLTSIVDDYLNITRIELGTMKYAFETIDLRALIEDVVAELKPTIQKAPIAFSFNVVDTGIEYRITADRDKLKQVIANLIDNSIKYTPQGWVAASLSFDRAKHKFVFMVKDSGIGIDPEVLPHLFQKFSRASTANKVNIKGTGLGLFVAKQMVEAHHGTIRAESPGEGKGSAFIVELDPFAVA